MKKHKRVPSRWTWLGGLLALALGTLAPLLPASPSAAQPSPWSQAVNVSDTSGASWFPALAVDSTDDVHVVWSENSIDARRGIASDSLLYSAWDGESWSQPNDLYTSRQADAYTLRPAIVADRADTLHLLYRYPTVIRYSNAPVESAWSAQAWPAPHRVSGRGESDWTDLALDSQDTLHAIWSESVVYALPGGVSVLAPQNTLFGKTDDVWITYTPSEGLADGNVSHVAIDAFGFAWFATDDGLSVLSPEDGRWATFTVDDGLASQRVQKVFLDGGGRGRKWLATQNGVCVLDDQNTPLDKTDDVWITFSAADGLASDDVLDVAADGQGNMWFATDRGVSVFSIAGERWLTFAEADGLAANAVQAVLVDRAGYKWFGTSRGASVLDDGGTPLDKSDDVWKTFSVESGLESGNVLALAADDQGRKWFGTQAGLSLLNDGGTPFDDADDEWRAFTTNDDLPDDQVTALAIDAAGHVWVGTAAGAGVLAADGAHLVPYTVNDGLAQNYVTAVALDPNGNVWLGTWGGEQEHLTSDVFYRRSTDRGQTWSAPRNLSRSKSPVGNSLHLHVDVQDRLHVVWDEAQSCGYISSFDGGETWSQRATFSSGTGAPHQIVVGVDRQGKILVAWRPVSASTRLDEDLPIYYQLSFNDGASWSQPAPIPGLLARASNDTSFDAYDVAVDSAGYLHLVAVGRTSAEETGLSVLHVTWNGNAWSQPDKVFSSTDFSERPALTIHRGNQLHLVWFVRKKEQLFSGGEGSHQVWYARGQSAAPAVSPPPSPTPLPTPTLTPTPVPPPTPTPYPTRAPELDELATDDLYTENDELFQLALALLPLILLVLLIASIRRGWWHRLFR